MGRKETEIVGFVLNRYVGILKKTHTKKGKTKDFIFEENSIWAVMNI